MRVAFLSWLLGFSAWADPGEVVTSALTTAMTVRVDSGKVLVGGGNAGAFAVARFNSDGSFDSTFGGTGIVSVNVTGGDDVANALTFAQGKILAAGSTSQTQAILIRYNSDGSLDTSLSETGVLVTNPWRGFNDVRVDSQGRIVIAGFEQPGQVYPPRASVTRLNWDGTLDSTFCGGVCYLGSITDTSQARSVAIDSSDRPVVAFDRNGQWWIARLLASGGMDGSFGTGGLVQESSISGGNLRDVQLQHGKIVIAGDFASGLQKCIGAFQHNSDGSPDTDFGPAKFCSTGKNNLIGGTLAIDSQQRLVLGGTLHHQRFVAVRFTRSGHLDTTFNSGGSNQITLPLSPTDVLQHDIDIDLGSDSVLLAGSLVYSTPAIGVVRLLRTGPLDPSF